MWSQILKRLKFDSASSTWWLYRRRQPRVSGGRRGSPRPADYPVYRSVPSSPSPSLAQRSSPSTPVAEAQRLGREEGFQRFGDGGEVLEGEHEVALTNLTTPSHSSGDRDQDPGPSSTTSFLPPSTSYPTEEDEGARMPDPHFQSLALDEALRNLDEVSRTLGS
ncbi:unnamed protein product [Darwinula stevensoni]|uniref:Uncharacterized protein n=1 Tax=Darwinula stevensoni TaxID=69355 RepID=A0A7R9AD33_9CRUS|nr:unnamed protein product [Darwinula stevensoni]CAG0900910.1 unnamed protein product [Darwinula stevensoni]